VQKKTTRQERTTGTPQDRGNKIKLMRNQYKRGKKRKMKENSMISQKNLISRKEREKGYTDCNKRL
jgi:hypothetical protein